MPTLQLSVPCERFEDAAREDGVDIDRVVTRMVHMFVSGGAGVSAYREYLRSVGLDARDAEALALLAGIYREPDYQVTAQYDRDVPSRVYHFIFSFTPNSTRRVVTSIINGEVTYREVLSSDYAGFSNIPEFVPFRVPVLSSVPQLVPTPDPPKAPPSEPPKPSKRRLRF